jgi:hypothetical protein
VLRRFETGELFPAEAEAVRAHVDSCAECRKVLDDFVADRVALRTALPFAALEEQFKGRPSAIRSWWRRVLFGAAAPGLAVAVYVLWASPPGGEATSPPGVTSKGTTCDLGVDVKTALMGLHAWDSGEPLAQGDRLRFRYKSEDHPFVLVFSVDSDGTVYPYVMQGEQSLQVTHRTSNIASNVVTLDEDLRPERLFLICSPQPLRIDEIRAAAKDGLNKAGSIEKLENLAIRHVQQTSMLLTKIKR